MTTFEQRAVKQSVQSIQDAQSQLSIYFDESRDALRKETQRAKENDRILEERHKEIITVFKEIRDEIKHAHRSYVIEVSTPDPTQPTNNGQT